MSEIKYYIASQDRANQPQATNTTELQQQLAAVTQERDRLQQQLDSGEGLADADAAALAEYREVVGELLPADYPGRKALLAGGYYTRDTVDAASDEELGDVEGIGDATVKNIRAYGK